ncbi:MAG: penicillin-binding protein 2 [bacterium]|nr:penicillin-binding protein 2 [bacterium]
MRPFRKNIFRERERAEINPEEIFMDAVNIHGFRHEMQEGMIERPITRSSFLAFGALVAIGLAVLVGRLADLALVRGGAFALQAQSNRTYPIAIAPPRGIFYDRNFKKLVENTPTFDVILKPAAAADDAEFGRGLSAILRLTGKTVLEIADVNGLDAAALAGDPAYRRRDWPPEIFIASGELRSEVLEIQSRPADFPAVLVREAGRRSYPLGALASHLLGYTGRPGRQDLLDRPGITSADTIGKDGLELAYEDIVRGRAGEKLIEVNAAGEALRERFIVKAVPGRDVVLEIDRELERFAAETLARHIRALGKKAGALVAIDPRDGAVRALVSYPGYDVNLIAGGASKAELANLLRSPAKPFFNRAISGGYPSASTVKPFLATAALEARIIDPEREIYDPGYISVPNPYDPANPTMFKDWKALGWIDMRRAIAFSANVYFYTIGGGYGGVPGLGIERIAATLARFGWGRPLGIDLPGEYGGLIPGPEKKKTIRPSDPTWRIGDTYITSIGQGDLQVTPLQLAAATAVIANGGTLWKPRLARAVVDEERREVRSFGPVALATGIAGPESFAIVQEGMRLAVTAGSAAGLAGLPVPVAGKTGTAETGVYGRNHGWFTGFAPYGAPEIVIAVLVEEGTGGSTDAVPIAREVLYYYFTAVKNLPPGETTGMTDPAGAVDF